MRSERLLRDTHLVTDPRDNRRMDLVAAPGATAVGARRGVPLFSDVTICSVLTKTGAARSPAATVDGGVLRQAVAAKRRKYADIVNSPHACLLVLGCELYGRWCDDAVSIVQEMASLKAQQAPPLLRGSAAYAWSNRWWSLVSVGVHRAIAESLLRHGGADLLDAPAEQDAPSLADVFMDSP